VTFQAGADPGLPLPLLEEIFQKVIVPDYLLRSNPEPQRHPEVVLLGGQPGAGKSTTASQFQREFAARGGLVWVTWDDFRPFHPDYERLLAERPADMPDVTRPAARWWQDHAAEFLRVGRYNVLLEGGFRNPDMVLATAERFAAAGYGVHVCALAVPAALSRLGIIERFARQAEVAGTGRWTTAASHDGDYSGTVAVLRLAEASPAVSRISLLTRDGLVYDNHRGPTGRWTMRVSAVAVLAEARDTPLTRLQRTALTHRLAGTLERLERAGLAHPALSDMAAEVEQDLARFSVDLLPALGHPGAPVTTLDAGVGQIHSIDPSRNMPPPQPPGPDLEL
jgi:UDP-N-acetylglucosamine kinase